MKQRIESRKIKKIMGNTLQKKPNEYLEKVGGGGGNESSFTCEICIEPMAASKKFKNKNLCTHPFCQDCIAKYIQAKVQDHNTAKIECPGLDCKCNLDPFSCEPVIPSSLFSKWSDVLCEDYVLGFERSYCPNSDCMALVVNECERSGKVKKTQCPNCKQWFCFQCKLKWHAGYNCEESGNLRDRNDILFGQLVERMNWARCPACGHCVERKDGCSVVMCRCNTRFCYECGRKISSGCSCQTIGYCQLTVLTIAMMVIFHVIVLAGMKISHLERMTAPDRS